MITFTHTNSLNPFYFMKLLLLGIVSSLFLISCTRDNKVKNVDCAFYFWSSNSYFDDGMKSSLKKVQSRKLYIKYFEVDYSEAMGNFPYEKTNFHTYDFYEMDSLTVVPTIFIKNEIFQYNTNATLDKLADNIVFLVDKYNKERFSRLAESNFKEIQIDCDWTKSTKDKYFYLLKKIKQLSQKEISCTLRLYPYKYPEIMGVPPVDKAMLMCYNLIKPLSEKDKNSILDVSELKKYLNKFREYPVHLDIALPIFNWAHVYQNNRFSGLVNLSTSEVSGFAKKTKPMWYEVTKDTVIHDVERIYFRVGDQIKCEDVTKATLDQTITLIKQNVALDDSTTITFFNIDNKTFNNYSHAEISDLFSSFTK